MSWRGDYISQPPPRGARPPPLLVLRRRAAAGSSPPPRRRRGLLGRPKMAARWSSENVVVEFRDAQVGGGKGCYRRWVRGEFAVPTRAPGPPRVSPAVLREEGPARAGSAAPRGLSPVSEPFARR